MIPEDEQFNIWEPEDDPRIWLRCRICGKEEAIADTPLVRGDFDPVYVFMAHHDSCLIGKQPAHKLVPQVIDEERTTDR